MNLTGYYQLLLDELLSTRLEVILVNSTDTFAEEKKVRAVVSKNPDWYRDICAKYIKNRTIPRYRKSKYVDTIVYRQDVVRILKRLIAGKHSSSFLIHDLKEAALALKEILTLSTDEMAFYLEYGELADDWDGQFQ